MRVLRWINPVTANLSSNESNKGLGKDEKKKEPARQDTTDFCHLKLHKCSAKQEK